MQKLQLRDVGVLKFIDEDVFVTLAELAQTLGIVFQERDGVGDGAVDGKGALVAKDFFAGAIRARNFLLQRDVFGALFVGVLIERGFVRLQFRRRVGRQRPGSLRWRPVHPGTARKRR